jgi:glycosyltransferase involved in cell wall biosynthesis
MHKNCLFLTLKVFSATGGIEKVCRILGKAAYDFSLPGNFNFNMLSLHDRRKDALRNHYFPAEYFQGYGGNPLFFILSSIWKARKVEVVVLSHINLMIVGRLIKFIFPSKKIMLFSHGIEVWNIDANWKRSLLKYSDRFICVSQHTKDQLIRNYGVDPNKCVVVNNCLDPFLPLPECIQPKSDLRARYGIRKDDILLFTLTRISAKERYKGYDKVLQALANVKLQYSNVKYLLAGSYDEEEGNYIKNIIRQNGLDEVVIMPGFIHDSEIADHFMISDLYIMPSLKEGFGIVFIEAMYYGLPVIAGNKDGSVDALENGKLGQLVDPLDIKAIEQAIRRVMASLESYRPERKYLMGKSGFSTYKKHLLHRVLQD